MKDYGKIAKLIQDDFDDGIQELVIKFENGDIITQKREWPDMKFRGEDSSNSAHEQVYYADEFKVLEKFDPDAALALICRCSKLVEGIDIRPNAVALESFLDGKVEVGSQEILHSHWFEVVQMSVRHSLWDGGMSEFKDHTFIKGREGVAAVLYDKEQDKIVLIEEFRIGAVYDDEPWLVGIPTGGLEEGEDPMVGAKRECIEEAGITPIYMEHMLTYKPSPGFTSHTQHIYWGLVDINELSGSTQGLDSEAEDIRVEVMDASEVIYQLKHKVFKNGTAINALNHFFMHHYTSARNTTVGLESRTDIDSDSLELMALELKEFYERHDGGKYKTEDVEFINKNYVERAKQIASMDGLNADDHKHIAMVFHYSAGTDSHLAVSHIREANDKKPDNEETEALVTLITQAHE